MNPEQIARYKRLCELEGITFSTPKVYVRKTIDCDCGKRFNFEDHDNTCPHCGNEYVKCSDCGDWVLSDDTTDVNGDNVCQDCLSENYSVCEHCDCYIHKANTHYANDSYVCDDCLARHYTRCYSCHEYVLDSETLTIHNGAEICESCYEDHYFTCETCGEIYHIDSYAENGECVNCYRENSPIKEHDYKPEPIFYGSKNEKLFFGFELETEYSDKDDLQEIAEKINSDRLYCKHDGSLNKGFEVVSHPMDYQTLTKEFDWDSLLKTIIKNGGQSHNGGNCGFHVHLSLRAFSTLHLYKFIGFFYNNPDFILFISQRHKDALSHWARLYDNSMAKRQAKYREHEDKYMACNITYKTLEVRVFRGNLRKERLLKNLEFIMCLYEYTQNAGMKDAIDGVKFLQYVNKSKYKNLKEFVQNKPKTEEKEDTEEIKSESISQILDRHIAQMRNVTYTINFDW